MAGSIRPPKTRPHQRPRKLLRAAFCDRPHRNAAIEGPQRLAADSPPQSDKHVVGPRPPLVFTAENRDFSQSLVPRPAAQNEPPQAFAAFGTASAPQERCRAAPPLGKPTRKVGPLAYSGRAVALPLTRTPMAGCSCRVGGPTFFLFTGLKSRGKAIFPDDP